MVLHATFLMVVERKNYYYLTPMSVCACIPACNFLMVEASDNISVHLESEGRWILDLIDSDADITSTPTTNNPPPPPPPPRARTPGTLNWVGESHDSASFLFTILRQHIVPWF